MAIHYTQSDGVSLGYTITGEGDESIVYVPGAFSNLAIERYYPDSVAWEQFLGRFGRVINFDKRATGVSDRSARPLNLDQQVVDVEAIRKASGSEIITLCGLSQGAPLAVLYALAYPEKVRALILIEGVCCDATDPYLSLSDSNTLFDWERSLGALDSDFAQWCWDFSERIAPGSSQEDIDLAVEYMQATASPASHRFIWCCLMGFDLRPMLRHITQPTLVIHGKDDLLYPVQHGRYFAEHIPGAKYLELDSNCHMPMFDEGALPHVHQGIENFMEALPPSHLEESTERVISTILFTDIVGSTEHQSKLGDRVWTEIISAFEENSTTIVEQCRGKMIRFTGDGIKAAFEVPGDGLRAARLLVQDASELGYPIRAGLHTGEIQWSGEDIHGTAVNIASRVADQADQGEVLTTTVTQGIVEGGDYVFTDWGEADLKGIGVRKLVRLLQE
ncbi:MAG: adenylate/guanylate cyclase domain-containing protein [Gammaproteobacteria bacterium]|nr:adenylate/guanylate cyclase domain-containing protein [Gammaproteobacteria bacterium]